MRLSFLLVIIIGISLSCKQEVVVEKTDQISPELIKVADNIIYDVVVKAETDDQWELEKVAGFSGSEMINDLFESLYSGELKARDYHSGKELASGDIRKIENRPGFERSNIGRIQFTEDWYYNPAKKEIEKKVRQIVFGYKTDTEDRLGVGYMAAFEILMK